MEKSRIKRHLEKGITELEKEILKEIVTDLLEIKKEGYSSSELLDIIVNINGSNEAKKYAIENFVNMGLFSTKIKNKSKIYYINEDILNEIKKILI